jgi:hypothetical protein
MGLVARCEQYQDFQHLCVLARLTCVYVFFFFLTSESDACVTLYCLHPLMDLQLQVVVADATTGLPDADTVTWAAFRKDATLHHVYRRFTSWSLFFESLNPHFW